MKRRDFLLLAGAVPLMPAVAATRSWDTQRDRSQKSDIQNKVSLVSLVAMNLDPSLALVIHTGINRAMGQVGIDFDQGKLTWKHAVAFGLDRSSSYLPVMGNSHGSALFNVAYGGQLWASPTQIEALLKAAKVKVERAERALGNVLPDSGHGHSEMMEEVTGLMSLYKLYYIDACSRFTNAVLSNLAPRVAVRVTEEPFDTTADAADFVGEQLAQLNDRVMNAVFRKNYLDTCWTNRYSAFVTKDEKSAFITGFRSNPVAQFEAKNQLPPCSYEFNNGWEMTTNTLMLSPSSSVIGGAEVFVSLSNGESRVRSRKGRQDAN